MQYEVFINKLVNCKDGRIKPFSPKFDESVFAGIGKKLLNRQGEDEQFAELFNNLLEVSKIMKKVYDDVFAAQKNIIDAISTPAFDILSHLVALVNCNFCAIVLKLNQQLQSLSEKVLPYDFLSAAKLVSIDSEAGPLPIDTSLEMQIDTLSMLFNYIRYFRGKKYTKKGKTGIEYVEAIKALFLNMNGLCALKFDYDDSILNDGFIEIDNGLTTTIKFDYFNHQHLKLLRTGATILNQKVMHEYNKNSRPDFFNKYFSGKRIKCMKISDGYVELKLSCGKNIYLDEKARSFTASIIGYYDYLKDVQLPNFETATIMEAISIWLLLQSLADHIQVNFKWKFDIKDKYSFGMVPCRISKSMLMFYLTSMSRLSKAKVKKILESFVITPDAFCDIWNEPLYDCGSYYTFPLFAISQGMSFNTIDGIIEKGGIDLQERGPIFEKYIVSELSKPHHYGYQRNAYGSRKYERNKGDFQEIDCIVELRDIVIVAELKCTQYPMNALNQHDCWDRLKSGCRQANIKAQYVRDNPKVFQKISATIPEKTILPIVVTNYPNFTGFSYEDVFVIDAHAFTSYLNTGVVTANTASKNGERKIIGVDNLYHNETEFASNFTNYLHENPLMKQIIKHVNIEEMVHPDIYDIKTKVVYASSHVDGAPIIKN